MIRVFYYNNQLYITHFNNSFTYNHIIKLNYAFMIHRELIINNIINLLTLQ